MKQILLCALLLFSSGAINAANPPIAKLMQPSGLVEYSANGNTWRPAPRIKYLFEGYMIRTGGDGAAKLVNQENGTAQTLSSNSRIEIKNGAIHLHEGDISEPREDASSIWQSILNKFALAQKYTTVRRGIKTCDSKVLTVDVTVSTSYPDLVWRNACPEFYYRLTIDGKAVEVPPHATAEMIRYSVRDLTPGEHTYKVEVIDVDGIIFSPRSTSKVVVLSDKGQARIERVLADLADDIYLRTNILSDNNMLVAAMDAWRTYFNEYPDENNLRPLLAESYARLRLDNLRRREARLYQSQLSE